MDSAYQCSRFFGGVGRIRTLQQTCFQRTNTARSSNRCCTAADITAGPILEQPNPADTTYPAYATNQHLLKKNTNGRLLMQYYQFRAMNTSIQLVAEADPERIKPGFQAARSFIENCERRFTRFSDDSELASLNRAAGKWFRASPDLMEIVEMAQKYHKQTRRLFDPSILTDLRRLGYDKSIDEIRVSGASPRNDLALARKPVAEFTREGFLEDRERPVFQQVKLDLVGGKIWMPPGLQLDLGGIAKGWIAEKAAGILSEYAPVCAVNAGGDMFLIGLPDSQATWEIGLEDPRQPEQDLATLKVGPGALATSSITKRTWTQGNSQRHHLIDPRSGMPAETEWLSMTVIAPHATTAEVYAKALLIAGKQEIQMIAQNNDDILYIGVDNNGELWGPPTSKEVIYAEQ